MEFRNVTFAYPGADAPVIKSVSFVSKPGETTAIIGRTGCGKSSIVKLIPRLYDTLFGDVLVDGVNVKDYKLKDLREVGDHDALMELNGKYTALYNSQFA